MKSFRDPRTGHNFRPQLLHFEREQRADLDHYALVYLSAGLAEPVAM